MEAQEALKIVDDFLKEHKLKVNDPNALEHIEKENAEGTNENVFCGGDVNLSFQYDKPSKALQCFALIYAFDKDPDPVLIDHFYEESKNPSHPMGGGVLEYDRKDKALYLKREYKDPVSIPELDKDLENLHDASVIWAEDIFPEVVTKSREVKK